MFRPYKHSGMPQDSLKAFNAAVAAERPARAQRPHAIGPDFKMSAPTVADPARTLRVFSLPNPDPSQLLDLSWESFGFGIERLARQIKNLGSRLDVDACFGVNEAGLVMATFLASHVFGRCPVGYLKCQKTHDEISLDSASFFPAARDSPTFVICDFEVKHADVVGYLSKELRARYGNPELYFAVFGAMTRRDPTSSMWTDWTS